MNRSPFLSFAGPSLAFAAAQLLECASEFREGILNGRPITVRDQEGRWCVYAPICVDGAPVRPYGFTLKS